MSDISAAEREAYDSVAYPTAIISHMTPDRIAAAGRLYGWQAPDPQTASVLEIGCGDGLNIIGIAAMAPSGRHVGFDLSAPAIARGQELIAAAGLTNVTLEAGDIMTWPREGAPFDYIICHGVYAWVPQPVQQAILEIVGTRLAPGGVAYVSYDALPAAAGKAEIQRYLVRRTAGIEGMEAKVTAAAGILATLSRHQVDGSRLKAQFEVLAKSLSAFDAAYFFHDWLAEHYAPPSLAAFAAASATEGLKVVGDAGLTDLFTHDLDDEAKALLGDEDDWAARGEALDFLRGAQMFRRSYLVRTDAPPPASTGLQGLHFSFDGGREESVSETTGESRPRYTGEWGTFLIPTSEEQAALMDAFWKAAPGELSYDSIVALIGSEAEAEAVLTRVCTLGLVSAHAMPPAYILQPGECPLAAPLTRALFAVGPNSITLRHARLIPNEPPTADFVRLCDGTRDRIALAAEMSARFESEITPALIDAAIKDIARRRIFVA
jgi:SAM-dependent methyltransferase